MGWKAQPHTLEECRNEALKYESRTSFFNHSKGYYLRAHRKGWVNEICGHMSEKIKPKNYWTYDRCKEEALKYEFKSDFGKRSTSAYSAARLGGWLEDICSHMNKKPRKRKNV